MVRAKPGFRGLFVNTFGKGKGLVGISRNIRATLEGCRGLCVIFFCIVDGLILKFGKHGGLIWKKDLNRGRTFN